MCKKEGEREMFSAVTDEGTRKVTIKPVAPEGWQ